MNKLIFTIAFLLVSTLSLSAQKLELENQNKEILMSIKMTGARSDLVSDVELNCSNRPGNKTYLDKNNNIKFRASVKLTHISIYSHPENKQLYRIGKKTDRYSITNLQGKSYFLRINRTGAELTDNNGKIIGKASYNSVSNNIKCVDSKNQPTITYKWPAANFSGILWLLNEIPSDIRMVMINELIR